MATITIDLMGAAARLAAALLLINLILRDYYGLDVTMVARRWWARQVELGQLRRMWEARGE